MNEIENRPAQYLQDMNYESAMAGEHECPTCGRSHEGAWEFCQTCGAGTCCEPEQTEHHVETWHRYTAEDLFGEDSTDDQQSLWRHAIEARADLLEENNRLQDELQDAYRNLRAAREQSEERGNEAVYYREERDEAQAALKQADERFEDVIGDQLAIENYLAYGDVPADNGLVEAIAAVRRRDRIRTALIAAPAALILGAAAALAAALL